MSDLPDDVRRWPSDPFKLLGVPRNVPPLELKRAYTRLIRAFKPEHAPEEFRRIRQAYEAARQITELHSAFQQNPPPEPASESKRAAEAEIVREPTESAAPRRAARVKSLEEQLDDCWQWAVDGDELKAYRVLEQLHVQAPHDSRIAIRLYWLLTLSPQIDPVRSSCDWLVAGLRRTGFSGPLRELYRRELAANPGEALSHRCAEIIAALGTSGGLSELVEWRWDAFPAIEQAAELISADLARLREWFLSHDEAAWPRLVFSAMDRVAFIDTFAAREVLIRCERDLKSLAHLHLRLAPAFDRYELLQEIVAKSRMLKKETTGHEEFLNVMRLAWNSSIQETREPLLHYLRTIASQPAWALKKFDAILELASALLIQFAKTLQTLEAVSEPAEDSRTLDELRQLVLSFARDTPAAKYSEWRPLLLDFCLREVIMPQQVADALVDQREFQLTPDLHLSQAVSSDLPLICVCHAYRLFWA